MFLLFLSFKRWLKIIPDLSKFSQQKYAKFQRTLKEVCHKNGHNQREKMFKL